MPVTKIQKLINQIEAAIDAALAAGDLKLVSILTAQQKALVTDNKRQRKPYTRKPVPPAPAAAPFDPALAK